MDNKPVAIVLTCYNSGIHLATAIMEKFRGKNETSTN